MSASVAADRSPATAHTSYATYAVAAVVAVAGAVAGLALGLVVFTPGRPRTTPVTTEAGPNPAKAQKPAPRQSTGPLLQVAAFRQQEGANSLAQDLEKKGYRTYVVQGREFFRVVVGPFGTSSEATQARSELEKVGYQPLVLRQRLP